jgi:hypothetical protein
VRTVTKHKKIKDTTAPRRGRPKKQKPQIAQPAKKPRGRPKKILPAAAREEPIKKRRGRPPKNNKALPVLKPCKPKTEVKKIALVKKTATTVKGPESIIESHPFYASALWIQQNISPIEEAYLKRTANRHNTTMLHSILEHMLGYFSIHNSALGAALKEVKKPTNNN